MRGLFVGGSSPNEDNVIQYLTISTTGNTLDFGDLTANMRNNMANFTNPTRAVLGPGIGNSNQIQFVNISTTGNAQDFGDISSTSRWGIAGESNAHGGL